MINVSRKSKSITIEAPASIANLGPGFDILAMAIDGFKDKVQITIKPGSNKISIKVENSDIPENENNVAYGVIKEAIRRYELHGLDFYVRIVKGVPVAYGLGSSGATAAATAYGVTLLTGLDLRPQDMVKLAGAGEAVVAGAPHYDNVSASLLGGVVLIDPTTLKVYKISPMIKFWIAIVLPNIPRKDRKTQLMRSILPREIELHTHIKQSANIAKIIYALQFGDLETLGEAISSDYIIEPHRARLIPGYWELKKIALENGALGFNIAGAGPATFSIYKDKHDAQRVGRKLLKYLSSIGISASLFITRVSSSGVRIVGENT